MKELLLTIILALITFLIFIFSVYKVIIWNEIIKKLNLREDETNGKNNKY